MPAHGAGASGRHASSQRGPATGMGFAAQRCQRNSEQPSIRCGTVGRSANRLDPRTSASAFTQRGMPISAFAEATADLAEACGGGGHSPRFAPDLQSRTGWTAARKTSQVTDSSLRLHGLLRSPLVLNRSVGPVLSDGPMAFRRQGGCMRRILVTVLGALICLGISAGVALAQDT